MNQIARHSQFKNKGEVFEALNSGIQLNDFHLPDHIYRADLIPDNIFQLDPRDRLNVLDAASVPILFTHGYPAFDGIKPMWEQLPGESQTAYDAFMVFMEIPEKSNHENPIRLLPHVSTLTKIPLDKVVEWCHIYYWHWRARAYDLFLIACHKKQREQRMMTIEGRHFALAEKTLNIIAQLTEIKLAKDLEALQESDNGQDIDLKTKDLIDMMSKVIQLQRISTGLPANGVSASSIEFKDVGPRHATADETFKSIAKEGASESATTQRSAEMDTLLQNPDDLSKVQEMMIRLNSPHKMPPAWANNGGHGGNCESGGTSSDNIIDVEPEPLDDADDDRGNK